MNRRPFLTQWQQAVLFLLILSGLIYLPALRGQLVWDDKNLVNGFGIGNSQTLPQCFTRPFLLFYFRPLGSVTFFIENRLWHGAPLPYHITNLVLHVAAVGALIGLLLSAFQSKRTAFVGGLLFALSPVQVSVVAFVGGRVDVLSTLWMLLFAWGLLAAVQTSGRRRAVRLGLSAAAYTLALLSKEQCLAVLPLVPLAFFCFPRKSAQTDSRLLPWLALVPYALLTIGFLFWWHAVAPPNLTPGPLTFPEWAAEVGQTVAYYFLLLLVPTPRWVHTFSLGSLDNGGFRTALPGYAALLAVLLLCVRLLRIDRRAVWFIGWVLLLLLPVLNLVPTTSLAVAPYRAALASIGVCALLALLLTSEQIFVRRHLSPAVPKVVGALLFGWYGLVTFQSLDTWHDEPTLYRGILRYDPETMLGGVNLSLLETTAGHHDEAIALAEGQMDRTFGAGVWRTQAGIHEAIRAHPHLLLRVRKSGWNTDAMTQIARLYALLGNAYFYQGNIVHARILFRIGADFKADDPYVQAGLAWTSYRLGNGTPSQGNNGNAQNQ